MKLEDRIKQLMEAKAEESETLLSEESIEELEEKETIKTKGGTTITDEDDSEDDHQEPDADDEGGESDNDEDDSDEDTEMSQDTGKKDKVDVKEGSDPFGSLNSNGSDEAGSTKTSKLKAKQGNKDDAGQGKLEATPSTGKTDDNGDNARLQAGASKKETNGKLSDGATGSGTNESNAKNAVDKNPQGVKEHMDALFNGEELSEEFQTKAATIFEAAVEQVAQARIDALTEEYAQEVVALQEEMEVKLNEAVEEVKSELVEQIDGFLNFVVEQWMEDNQVALESGMKVEMMNSFIDGLKNLFSEHYVDLPEEKLDIVSEQANEIETLESDATKLAEKNQQLYAELVALKSALVFESVSDDLTDVQKEKFSSLVENIEFTTDEEYTSKLETMKENYFPNGQTIETKQEQPQQTDDSMSSYVKAVTQNLKFR
jgi:hypothetical protein